MSIDIPFLVTMLAVAYLINVLVTRDRTSDRLLLRAPIVAMFATLAYGYLTVVFGAPLGVVVFLALLVKDVTPGKMLGRHA